MTDITQSVQNVTFCLQQNQLTISSYIHHVLRAKGMDDVRLSLSEQAIDICQDLYAFLPAQPAVLSWAISVAKNIFQKDVQELTQEQHALRFNAKHASSAYLEGSFMHEAATKMEKCAPNLWDLVISLLDADPSTGKRRAMPESDQDIEMGKEDAVQSEREMDLGEFGGDDLDKMDVDDSDSHNKTDDKAIAGRKKSKKRWRRAGARNAALSKIVRKYMGTHTL